MRTISCVYKDMVPFIPERIGGYLILDENSIRFELFKGKLGEISRTISDQESIQRAEVFCVELADIMSVDVKTGLIMATLNILTKGGKSFVFELGNKWKFADYGRFFAEEIRRKMA